MAVPLDHRKLEILNSPSGIVTSDIASKPGPLRRACGWLAIVVSPVPGVAPFVALFQSWDRLGDSSTPLWVLPLVMLCYAAFSAAVLWVGSGLVSGRAKRVRTGCWSFLGTLLPFLTLFSIFD